jgi:pyrroline-5-carboxylate reductase
VAARVPLEALRPVTEPAAVIRAMPISCAAINQSPTLLYPDHPQARTFFSPLGPVHVLPDEQRFTAASVIAGFYAWLYALMDETVGWTAKSGVAPETARSLVLQTIRGAADMALSRPEEELSSMLKALATPGGMTEQGLAVLRGKQGLAAWTEALDTVRKNQ